MLWLAVAHDGAEERVSVLWQWLLLLLMWLPLALEAPRGEPLQAHCHAVLVYIAGGYPALAEGGRSRVRCTGEEEEKRKQSDEV